MKAFKKTIVVLLNIIVFAFILIILVYKVSEFAAAKSGCSIPGIDGTSFISANDRYDSLGINMGDMIITKKTDPNSLKSGDIAVYIAESGKICFGRIEGIMSDSVQFEQAGGVPSSNYNLEIQGVEGVYSIRIPYLGYVTSFTDTLAGSIACIALPAIIVFIFVFAVVTDIVHNTSRHKRRILRRKQRRRERYKKEGLNRRAMI